MWEIQMNTVQNCRTIFCEMFLGNSLIIPEIIDDFDLKAKNAWFIEEQADVFVLNQIFDFIDKSKLDAVIDLLRQNNLFNEEIYSHIIKQKIISQAAEEIQSEISEPQFIAHTEELKAEEEQPDIQDQTSDIQIEEVEGKQIDKTILKHDKKHEKNTKTEQKIKNILLWYDWWLLTEEQITSLFALTKNNEDINLFKIIPWNAIPKTINNKLYTQVQLARFIDSWASDFFLETQKKDGKIYFRVLFRIKGENVLQDITPARLPDDLSDENENIFFEKVRKYIGSDLARLNADLKITSQDSSFSFEYKWKTRDFRINMMPARCYWKPHPRYAIRLTTDWDAIKLEDIEMLPFAKDFYIEIVSKKFAGVTIITGPTWSGKTTTIYAILNKIDKTKEGWLSIENPIEAQIHWLNQTEEDAVIREKWERYTTKEGYKWILRQWLDGFFIWEMRDKEEAAEWIKAWLIWNKVITTFHTNSVVDTFLRLKEEWLSNNIIWNGCKFITAQRLVKKLCPHCALEDDENKDRILKEIQKIFTYANDNLELEIKKLLSSIEDDEILTNINLLERYIWKNIRFLTDSDIRSIIDEIERNISSYQTSTIEQKKEVILEIIKDYPNKKVWQYFVESSKDPKILVASKKWCPHCDYSGYVKRVGIFEQFKMSKAVKNYIQDPTTKLIDLEDFLEKQGFLNLRKYWYLLALQWLVEFEELNNILE